MNAPSRKRMLVLCPFPQGVAAGQRLKYEQYFDDWRRLGYEIQVSSFMDEAMWRIVYEPGHPLAKIAGTLRGHLRRLRDLFRIRRYDLVYVYMWVTPFGTESFERLTRQLARKLIFDVEDNVMLDSATGAARQRQSAGPVHSRARQGALPDPHRRSCHHVLAVAQRHLPGDQREAGLHLHLVVGRHRPLRSGAATSRQARRRRSAGPARSARESISTCFEPFSRGSPSESDFRAEGDRQFRL